MVSGTGAALLQRLLALPGRDMRSFALQELLNRLSPEHAARVMDEIVHEARLGEHDCQAALIAFVDLIEDVHPARIEGTLFLSLLSLAATPSLRLLLKPPQPHRFNRRGEEERSDAAMDYVPLGMKRAMAKRMDLHLVRRMVLEKDPRVVCHLLSNPLVTEKEVLKIASQRPTTPQVLRAIYCCDRWARRYAVREAVARNPYAPLRIALAMLFTLKSGDLRGIAADETLHPDLREESRRAVEDREMHGVR